MHDGAEPEFGVGICNICHPVFFGPSWIRITKARRSASLDTGRFTIAPEKEKNCLGRQP